MKRLIILNGPSGSGKSTVANILWQKMSRTAIVNIDEIKWMISDYKSDDHDLDLARSIGLNMVEGFLQGGLSVITEKAFCKKEYLEPYISLSKKLGIPYFLFNIEAPLETLISRAKDRSLKENRRFSEEKIRRIHSEYSEGKIEAKAFDSAENSADDIAEMILNLV